MPFSNEDINALEGIQKELGRIDKELDYAIKHKMPVMEIKRRKRLLERQRCELQKMALFQHTPEYENELFQKKRRFEKIVDMIKAGATDEELRKTICGLDRGTIAVYRRFIK